VRRLTRPRLSAILDRTVPAEAITHFDTETVRVTTWTFQDADATGHHVHEYDYVIVPVTGGTFEVIDADATVREVAQEAAVPYQGHAGTSHDVINRSGRPATFIEIELKA
jgi:beta-alanine degradation protein BauB